MRCVVEDGLLGGGDVILDILDLLMDIFVYFIPVIEYLARISKATV